MATAYVGPRPVLRGVDSSDMVNPYTTMTGKTKGTGTYSYYPLYNTSHLLTGAPDRAHTIGTGYFPGDVFMSQLFRGLGDTLYVHPLAGTFRDGYGFGRFNPDSYKGLATTTAFTSGFGHVERENEYKHRAYRFAGIAAAQTLVDSGHSWTRTDATGAANSFGYFIPDQHKGVTSSVVFVDYGQANTTGNYGRNKVQEWKGVASSKVL